MIEGADGGTIYCLTDSEVLDMHTLFTAMRADLQVTRSGLLIATQLLGKVGGAYVSPLALPMMTQLLPKEAAAFFDGLELPESLSLQALGLAQGMRSGGLISSPGAGTTSELDDGAVVAAYEASHRLAAVLSGKRRPSRVARRAAEAAIAEPERAAGLVALCRFANEHRRRRSTLERVASACGLELEHVDRWVAAGPLAVAPERAR